MPLVEQTDFFNIHIYKETINNIVAKISVYLLITDFVSAFYWNLNCHSKNIHLIWVVVRYVAGGIAYDTFLF